ncbi:DUF1194 domain-containing protein [Ruegeria sp. NA]|nr:DUF1194 domain-containing protein [Ruegeria sp. NA]MCX8952557.1 DUF1194 domain-containing protein [Ruegeria sp. NA]
MSNEPRVIGAVPGSQNKPNADKATKRKNTKDAIRRTFLTRLPKGGVAVEIGVWQGEFSPTILKLLEPSQLFLIDPWKHIGEESHTTAFVGRTEDEKMEAIFQKVVASFEKEIEEGKVGIIRDFSVPALKLFDDESISFAYVDGDHSYEGVTADLTAYFFENVIVGEGAFVVSATGFADYPERIRRKLLREVTRQTADLK